MTILAFADTAVMPLWAIIVSPLITAVVGLIVAYTEAMRQRDKIEADKEKENQLAVNRALLNSITQTQQIAKTTFDTVMKTSDQQFAANQGLEVLKAHFNIPAPDVPKPPSEEELALKKIQSFISEVFVNKTKPSQHISIPPLKIVVDDLPK